MLDDWLSVADVAERAGVLPATVHTWLYLHKMPPPEDRVGQSPIWKRQTIETWLKSRSSKK